MRKAISLVILFGLLSFCGKEFLKGAGFVGHQGLKVVKFGKKVLI